MAVRVIPYEDRSWRDPAVPVPVPVQELVRMHYLSPGGKLMLAYDPEVREKIIGMAGLRRVNGQICEAKNVVVFWGFQKKGVGRLLIEALVREAQGAGFVGMRAEAPESVPGLVKFFERAGFSRSDAGVQRPGWVRFERAIRPLELTVSRAAWPGTGGRGGLGKRRGDFCRGTVPLILARMVAALMDAGAAGRVDVVSLFGVMIASAVASAINSVAGGGTFLTFPALTGVARLSEKAANMTSTIGIWPGQAASIVAAKADFAEIPRSTLVLLSAISLLGGTLGALLLLVTSTGTFRLLIPWLLLFATLIFGFSKPIGRWAGHQHGKRTAGWTMVVAGIQFVVAIYGGYFGAGIGVLMLAALSFTGLPHLNQINALKVFLAAQINGVAVVVFMISSIWIPAGPERMNWPYALAMMPAGMVGGFFGMRFARQVKQNQLRAIILLIGMTLTAIYFYRAYGTR